MLGNEADPSSRELVASDTMHALSSILCCCRARLVSTAAGQQPQGLSGAHRGALKGHVLKEVGGAVGHIALVAAASIDPHPHRCSARVRHLLAGHAQTAGQAGHLQQSTGRVKAAQVGGRTAVAGGQQVVLPRLQPRASSGPRSNSRLLAILSPWFRAAGPPLATGRAAVQRATRSGGRGRPPLPGPARQHSRAAAALAGQAAAAPSDAASGEVANPMRAVALTRGARVPAA